MEPPALRRSTEIGFAVFESAAHAAVCVDRGGRILMANREAERMFGFQRSELLQTPIDRLIPPPTLALGKRNGEVTARRKDGVEFPVEVSLTHVDTEIGEVTVALITDISARRKLEAELVQARSKEAISAIAAGIAHDFNNMLTVVIGCTQLVLDHFKPNDPVYPLIIDALTASNRASQLTKQFLAHAAPRHPPATIDPNRVIVDAERMLRRAAGDAVRLMIRLTPNPQLVRMDATDLERLLVNLVINARDAMPHGGSVLIETRAVGIDEPNRDASYGCHGMQVEVTDTGRGMDEETRRRIFEAFFTTKPVGHGTGLGLTIVEDIVNRAGGSVQVLSEPNVGTTFQMYFPVAEPAPEPSRAVRSQHPDGGDILLVVDGDAGVRELMAVTLRRFGFTALTAGSPEQAFTVSRTHEGPIAVLILELGIAGTFGTSVADQLRRERPDMKVLFVLGGGPSEASIGAGDAVLAKPFAPADLVSRVRALLNQ